MSLFYFSDEVVCNVSLQGTTAGKPSLLVVSVPSLTVSIAVRQDGSHEATTHSPNSFCSQLISSDCWMRNRPELRPGRPRRPVDQLAGHGLDDQFRRNVSSFNYKAKGTDLGHIYAFRRHHYSPGNSPERGGPQ